jgi:ATP-dependent DNA helicase 2 subunit 2
LSLTKVRRNPQEYAALDDLYSPIIHRINQALRERAVDHEKKIEDIIKAEPKILMKYSEPPEELITKAKPQIENLKKFADVKLGMVRIYPRMEMCLY